jgi:hypothetical protein
MVCELGYIFQGYKIDLQALIPCNGQNDDCKRNN